MRARAGATFAALLALVALAHAAAAISMSGLHVVGNTLVNGAGQAVLLHVRTVFHSAADRVGRVWSAFAAARDRACSYISFSCSLCCTPRLLLALQYHTQMPPARSALTPFDRA